jgi:hypothetical protein
VLWQIGAAQTLGLSEGVMLEIRSAAQGMLRAIHDTKKFRVQDILQGKMERFLAGRTSEFVNRANIAIVEARMVLPKDDPCILSAQEAVKTFVHQQAIKNAEGHQNDKKMDGEMTKRTAALAKSSKSIGTESAV